MEEKDGKPPDRNAEIDLEIVDKKQKKSRSKAAFTRYVNGMKDLCREEDTESDYLKDQLNKIEEAMDKYIEDMNDIIDLLKLQNKSEEIKTCLKEITDCEEKYENILSEYNQAQEECRSSKSVVSSEHDATEVSIGKDMWKQLQKVRIPVFNGEKQNYESWKAAFMSCVDAAPATKEYKLLQLRNYLSGTALNAIEELGHSAKAYDIALERIERKFGGKRRKIHRYLELIENFPPVNPKSLESFADLLDMAIVNMEELELESELNSGLLYLTLQRKLPQTMLTSFHRWLAEKQKTESVHSLKEFVLKENEYNTISSETKYGLTNTQRSSHRKPERTFHVNPSKTIEKSCPMCAEKHRIWDCRKFKGLAVEKRWEKAKEMRLCYRCLKSNHTGANCKNFRKCEKCQKLHHKLLHKETSTLNPEAPVFKTVAFDQSCEITQSIHDGHGQYIALRTIPVTVRSGNRFVRINALLDDASTKTYINQDIAAELKLNGEQKMMQVKVLNNQTETFESTTVKFEIESTDGTFSKETEAQTVKHVTGNLKVIDWEQEKSRFKHLRNINFPTVNKKPQIDMLIGLDNSDMHISKYEVTGKPGEPVARLTPLGWTCVGLIHPGCEDSFVTLFVNENERLERSINRFWEVENMPLTDRKELSPEDSCAVKKVEETLKVGQEFYEVSLPWKENRESLTNNYKSAVKRLENTEKGLQRDKQTYEKYSKTITSYEEKGYIAEVQSTDIESELKCWYLPHFPIIKPEKETTKVRIVFDASARHKGVCLNDVLEQGPKLQGNLFEVLMRFRHHSVAVVGDVAEMYLQVRIAKEDQPFLRFLWRESPDQQLKTYQFSRVVFGINASPFLAQYVSQHNAKKYAKVFPLASETVLKSTYMDDNMDSKQNDSKAVELYTQLKELWGKAGMRVRKWLSNSAEVLKVVPKEDRARQVDLTDHELPTIKTLGVLWKAEDDNFTFKSAVPDLNVMIITKRNFLKKLASIFDPLGFLAPYIMSAKILMQNVWLTGTDWDEVVAPPLKQQITNWFQQLNSLEDIQLPRCLQKEYQEEELDNLSLHTFVDASNLAYGTVVYTRCAYKDGTVITRLVSGKGKVAPLETISVPRLELLGATLGLKLTEEITRALNMKMTTVTFWCDSMNVLYWIRNRSRQLKTFVANRVAQVQKSTSPQQWRYIPSGDNPADLVSRGLTANGLIDSELWWQGPEFLKKSSSEWPENKVEVQEASKRELKKLKSENFSIIHVAQSKEDWRLRPENYSNWLKLVRVSAWVIRFIENCKSKKDERITGALTATEIEDRMKDIIKETQREYFSDEFKSLSQKKPLPSNSKLIKLNPKIDTEMVIRSDGRLAYAEYLSYDTRYPIILPRRSPVTRLIVQHYHKEHNHGGTNQTLSALSTKYWILSAREEIREVETNCMECRRRKSKAAQQIMAPLPNIRLNVPLRAFGHTAVDFAGPFVTVQGRGKRREKRYLCLFTCLATRAVHLEMAYGLDTSSFLNAFYRMVNRRGLPVKMLSDNGTNFIGADKELKELVKVLVQDKDKILDNTANKGIDWQFNPPLAPHWGGVHETLIKTAKRAIYAVLKNADITDEELSTAISGAEGLMNSRPLTYQTANPMDCGPLTPNHLLFGQCGGQFAPESCDTTAYSPAKRWRRIQELVNHFWKRWLREWLPGLNSRGKWNRECKDIRVDDIVIVVNPDVSRANWPLGRVTTVFPSKDGHIRAATILLGTGKEITRPIVKLCPLELNIKDSY